jgi:hypothetical protein
MVFFSQVEFFTGFWSLATGFWQLASCYRLLVSGSASSKKQAASSKKPKTKPCFENYLLDTTPEPISKSMA